MQRKVLDDDLLDKVISNQPIVDREKKGRYWLATLYRGKRDRVLDIDDLENFKNNIVKHFPKLESVVGQLEVGENSGEYRINYSVIFKESVAFLKGIETHNVFPGVFYYLTNSGFNIFNSYAVKLVTRVKDTIPVNYGIELDDIKPAHKRVVFGGNKLEEKKLESGLGKVVKDMDYTLKVLDGNKEVNPEDVGLVGDMDKVFDEIYLKEKGLKFVVAGLVTKVDELGIKHEKELEEIKNKHREEINGLKELVAAMGKRLDVQESKHMGEIKKGEELLDSEKSKYKELSENMGLLKIEVTQLKQKLGIEEVVEVEEKTRSSISPPIREVEVEKNPSSRRESRSPSPAPERRRDTPGRNTLNIRSSPRSSYSEPVSRSGGRGTPVSRTPLLNVRQVYYNPRGR